jgi:S1-C subfamily serine protease
LHAFPGRRATANKSNTVAADNIFTRTINYKLFNNSEYPLVNNSQLSFSLLLTLLLACFPFSVSCQQESESKDEAEKLFASHSQSIYQIRVIELATGNKAAIGSGFLIDNQGHIATNFHVVSNFVHQPARYRLEYATVDGHTGNLELIDIDVVHDLAITKGETGGTQPVRLGHSKLSKGTRIFSLGNPHDLGLSVVEGTYNGLLEKSLFDKIFFSGSLNPGMSGGPTLNHAGQVIGINVSTAGNQVSFLVPVHYLKDLLTAAQRNQTQKPELKSRIEQQLFSHQEKFINRLIKSGWKTTGLGPFNLPGSIDEIFKCWGDSDDDQEALMEHAYSNCFSEDQIFLAQRFTTGGLAYTYDYYRSKELSSVHFYNLYSNEFSRPIRVNSASKDDVDNYQCHVDFVEFSGKNWKMSFCSRQYKNYPSLYDTTVSVALVSESDIGLVIQLTASGVSRDTAMAFTRKFVQHITWQK